MIKYIVAPAIGIATDDSVIATALAVAKPFGAHIDFLHVRVDVAEVAAAAAGGGIGIGAAITQTGIDSMETTETEAEARAFGTVTRLCESSGILLRPTPSPNPADGDVASADFVTDTGREAEVIAAHGRFADLIVIGRMRDGAGPATDVLEAALLDSGRPLLIVPDTAATSLFGTLVIAWTDTHATLRAVQTAAPFIERASRVVLLCVDPDEDQAAAAEQQLRALRWHNRNVTMQHEAYAQRPPVEALLEIAKRLDASLLVMGGYGHSPVREMLFGGATHSILNDAHLPVLMAH